MKKFIFCLCLGLLTIAITSCEKAKESITVDKEIDQNVPQKPNLEDILPFPVPSHWGVTMSEFKTDVQKQGYKIIDSEESNVFAISYEIYQLSCKFNDDGLFACFAIYPMGNSDTKDIWEYLTTYYTEEAHRIEGNEEYYLFLDKETKTWAAQRMDHVYIIYYFGSTIYGSDAYEDFLH